MSHNADVNAEDSDKATALHAAAREGHADVCLELLEQGAAIEAQDGGNWTPLLWACYRGHVAAADCLISRGANINARGLYQGKEDLTDLVAGSIIILLIKFK